MKLLSRPFAVCLFLLSVIACQKPNGTGVHVDAAEAALIPQQSQAIAGFDLQSLKNTALYKKHSDFLNRPIVESAGANIGLDPRRDISKLLVAFAPEGQTVAIAQGSFSSAAVQQKLSAGGAQVSREGNETILSSGAGSVAFPQSGLALAGPSTTVRSVLEGERNKTNGVSAPLRDRLQLLPSDDQVWFVSTGRLPVQRLAGGSGAASMLSSFANFINATSIGLHVDAGLQLRGNLNCTSEHDAKQVHDAIKGLIGLARLTAKTGNTDLLKAYDAIQVDQNGQTVHVQADLSPELTEELIAQLPELRNSAGTIAR